jgi:hypothetical protein
MAGIITAVIMAAVITVATGDTTKVPERMDCRKNKAAVQSPVRGLVFY